MFIATMWNQGGELKMTASPKDDEKRKRMTEEIKRFSGKKRYFVILLLHNYCST